MRENWFDNQSGCMSVTDLNQLVRYICHVVEVSSKLHNDFKDHCHFNSSAQLVSAIVSWLFLIEKLQKHSFALQHDQ